MLSLTRLAAITAALLAFAATTYGATIGIDLGAEYFKIVSVTQGQGIDIVLNEQSQRKTSTYIGFRGEDRYIGEDARALAPRFPSNMLTYIQVLLGEEFSDKEAVERFKNKLVTTYDLVEDEKRGTIRIKIGTNESYSVEELLAMQMSYIKSTSEKYLDQGVSDAVIAVPHHYNYRQRQIVIDSAELGGLNVLSLIDHTTAAALQYGVNNRGFANGRTVLVVDYGASGLEVGVFKFDPLPPQISKKKSGDVWGGMYVLAIESDSENGGRYMDAEIAKLIARRFQQKKSIDLLTRDDSEGRKARVKLMRSAQKAKETLSANREVQLTVEGLWDEQDFLTTVTRAEFDAEIAGSVAKAMEVVKRAVKNSGVDIKDIEVLELMGGNTRVPAFQEKLQEYFGRSLGRSLNTDEAIAFGAAFQSARQSGSFRVRSFSLHQNSTNNIQFKLSATEATASPAPRTLFPNSPLPSRRVVTVPRVEDFNMTVLLKGNKDGEDVLEGLDEIHITKVKTAFEKLGYFKDDRHPDSQASVELRFELTEGDTLTLAGAIAKFKQVKVVNVTAPAEGKKARKGAAEAAKDSKEEAKDKAEGEAEKEEGEKAEKAEKPEEAKEGATEEATPEAKPEAEEGEAAAADAEPKTKTVVKNLKQDLGIKVRNLKSPLPLSAEDKDVSKAVLKKLDQRDEEKRRVSEARNTLETLIYSTKYDGFLDNEELKPFFNETTDDDVRKVVTAVEEWLETDEGSNAQVKELRAKVREIQAATAPVRNALEAKRESEKKKKAPKKEKVEVESEAETEGEEGEEEEATEKKSKKTNKKKASKKAEKKTSAKKTTAKKSAKKEEPKAEEPKAEEPEADAPEADAAEADVAEADVDAEAEGEEAKAEAEGEGEGEAEVEGHDEL